MNIGYKLYKNAMPATAEKAPYLGMAIPVGSLAYDNILKEMVRTGTRMTQPTAKFFLEALYEYAAETIARESVRINVGTVSIYPMIDGSFDSEDAEFDPARNSLYVGASLSQELRDQVAGIAPDYAGDKSVGTVRLHSCLDLTSKAFKVISGTDDFRLAGENLVVPDGSDESLGLYAKNGVDKVADIEVSETDGGQRITCHVVRGLTAVPKGTYKVRLCSHGLDPTDPLAVCTLTVTLVEDIPESTEPYFLEPTGDFPIAEGATYFVPGGHLPAAEDWTLTKGSSLNLVVKPSDDPATHLIGMAQAGDLDADASGPDGVTIKGDFLVKLFEDSEVEPEPGREYPVELAGQIGATSTNTVAFMAKAHD